MSSMGMSYRSTILLFILVASATSSVQAGATVAGFLQVTANIYRGGRPTESDLVSLQNQYKVMTDIDLEDDTKVNDQEQADATNLQMQFLLTPMNPYATPTDADVNGVLGQLQNAKYFPIFIHCHYGEDRTGLIIGIYRVEVQGWTPAQAYQEMLANGFHKTLTYLDNYFRKRTGYTGA
jgi:protein tyrosine/serine phosphatase